MHPSQSALVEIGIMFLPAIPAYLWMWSNLQGTELWVVQILVYIYILAGSLLIGLRRWSWYQLGVNRKGIWLSLGCGLALLAGRLMIIFSVNWSIQPAQPGWLRAVGDLLYYIGVVGLVEEFLFRGLVYRLLEDWHGLQWAILGSSFGFLLWHLGQGPLIGLVGFFYGFIFALIRWRSGGILGLILVHGFTDLATVWLVSDSNAQILAEVPPEISSVPLLVLGLLLLVFVPLFLWKVHPSPLQKA